MSDREKLIELFNEANEICVGTDCCKCSYAIHEWGCVDVFVTDHLISNGVTVQKWIPVSERLPEVEEEYITYTDREQIHFDCFCIYPNLGTRFWVGGNGKVTHWMPLPEPPKECE